MAHQKTSFEERRSPNEQLNLGSRLRTAPGRTPASDLLPSGPPQAQDLLAEVPYTDVDYRVFSEAAESVALGLSPYAGRTPLLDAEATRYRYTPLLAYLLLPNIWLHRAWGKVCTGATAFVAHSRAFVVHSTASVAHSTSFGAHNTAFVVPCTAFVSTVA